MTGLFSVHALHRSIRADAAVLTCFSMPVPAPTRPDQREVRFDILMEA
ncbi:hypothetical protein [Gluconobacter morbifer]|uniref:Uncharacterized protein n=1 Tax=Gluconobacter morbifer G707 TaxID=1088869 RepID=G6XEV9_9PROT|nr:hypothetical protein [Gluconobacter morbifer]EHH68717.1 hypothetical protein GMO_00240 [Gluconobacter morbifer G707]